MSSPDSYVLSESKADLQVDRILKWLDASYWARGIPRSTVERCIAGSHCIGAYCDGVQIGFARVVTDFTTFAYLADVCVDESARGIGVARAMVGAVQQNPELQSIRRWLLATRDAHGLYLKLGWLPLASPELFLERFTPSSYAR